MMAKQTGQGGLHQHNLSQVLQQIFNNQPISRVEIARRLNLNKSTVSALYHELDQQGYIHEIGAGTSTSAGGRKPVLVKINGRYGYTISFDLGFRHLHVIANYLDGRIIFKGRIQLQQHDLQEVLHCINDQIDRSLAADTTQRGLLGIGFSIHGVVANNQIISSPFIDMGNLDLADYYQQRYQVPVLLENEANLVAIYQRDFGQVANDTNILAISIHRGIGAGIILDGQLYRGRHGQAGEIGRSLMFTHDTDDQQYCKVEDFCSEDAIIEQVQHQTNRANLDRRTLVQLNQAGDAIVQASLNKFSRSIAKVIYNVAISLAPTTIYLSSPLIEAIPELLTAILAEITALGLQTPIQLTTPANLAPLLGCCALVTHEVLNLQDYELSFANLANL
ncbi:MAG: ROK family transcriptional regulator [Lactobacillus sp.]|nr:ROK family transcriptional regulator [Lactobacillus sp.]